jgi:1A family penicillin-binding protein
VFWCIFAKQFYAFNTIIKTMFKNILKKLKKIKNLKKILLFCLITFFVFTGAFLIWITTIELPNIDNFENRIVSESTKIYDRTGKVVLFDVHGNVRRTVVPLDKISDHVKHATIAIEDANFYNHNGIEPTAIIRAIYTNIKDGNLLDGQGGSTITQQVIKNSLLTSDKKISRKIKEWILAPRLENKLTKDQILEIYLNEVPYGGTVYGVQEASRRFFAKDATDLTLVESAYLAALPQAPTFFSPYGNNVEALENRKNKVLLKMFENNFITKEEYEAVINEKVEFEKQEDYGIKAPHFVMYIREILEKKYGVEAVEKDGLKVITTLDWDLQKEAETIVKEGAFSNKKAFDAENMSITAVEPSSGQILTMVGSRDYFDEEIDGNFNIATTKRQPGSSFKPFVYAEAFNRGYRPETVVYDLPTEFSTACASGGECYNPSNYDGGFRGPINLRNALAQSINIPAIKVLYLVGVKNAMELAKSMGIETLTNPDRYGLTLVLGGGEVSPLNMASAYAVFANDGIKNETTGILRVEDKKGKVLEEYKQVQTRILPEQTARMINSVLSDNPARTPIFGANSYLNIDGYDVAVKTGTTNDYRDAWTIGYTPSISVAAWAGNNDNRSMSTAASSVSTPYWNKFIRFALTKYPSGSFIDPDPQSSEVKDIIKGVYNTEDSHSILYYVDKNNPLGDYPSNPSYDPQFELWEAPVRAWSQNKDINELLKTQNNTPQLNIVSPEEGKDYIKTLEIFVAASLSKGTIVSGKVYLNKKLIGELDPTGGVYSFFPSDESASRKQNTIVVEVVDENNKTYSDEVKFGLIN